MQKHTLTVPRTARYYTLLPDERVPVREVWVVCHGYGQLAAYFLRHFRAVAAPGRLIVAPEGLSRFYLDGDDGSGTPGTYERVAASWMTRDDRLDEIADQAAYLDTVFAEVCARHDADVETVPLVGFGFSQGAATMGRWLDRSPLLADRPERVRHLVTWGNVPPHDLLTDGTPAWLEATGVTVAVGTEDRFLTPERLAQARAVLDEAGVAYDLVRFEGGHHLHAETLRALAGPVPS